MGERREKGRKRRKKEGDKTRERKERDRKVGGKMGGKNGEGKEGWGKAGKKVWLRASFCKDERFPLGDGA